MVLGVDPGSRETGLVLRTVDRLVAADVVVRRDNRSELPTGDYLTAVVGAIFALHHRGRDVHVALEGIRKPTGFAGGRARPMNPMGLVGTGVVYGAILAAYPDAAIVAPRKHGEGPRARYPVEIRMKEGGAGADRNRHARAAWDIAGSALIIPAATPIPIGATG